MPSPGTCLWSCEWTFIYQYSLLVLVIPFVGLQETKGILRARKLGIRTPTVYLVDQQTSSILMEKVRGITVKDWIREGNYTEQDLEKVLTDIGEQVSVMHDGGLIHGDLTTSNMIIGEGGLDLVSTQHENGL